MSTMPVLNFNTYEMAWEFKNQQAQIKANWNKCKQRQFSQDKHAQLAKRDKENCFIVVTTVTSSLPYMMASLNDRKQTNILLS